MRDDPIVIDAAEFEAAKRDPRTRELLEAAEAYVAKLVESGHCPKCLVINCEHITAPVNEAQQHKPIKGILVRPRADVDSVWVELTPPVIGRIVCRPIQMTPTLARELAEQLTSAAACAETWAANG